MNRHDLIRDSAEAGGGSDRRRPGTAMPAAKWRSLPGHIFGGHRSRRAFLGSLGVLLGTSTVAGRVEAQSQAEDAEPKPGRAAQPPMEAMRRIARRVRLTAIGAGGQTDPVTLRPEPLLRYGDPAHNVLDGTLWAWGGRGRPAALLKVEDRRVKAGQDPWGMSITSLSADRLALEYDGLAWQSCKPGMEARPLPDAPGRHRAKPRG